MPTHPDDFDDNYRFNVSEVEWQEYDEILADVIENGNEVDKAMMHFEVAELIMTYAYCLQTDPEKAERLNMFEGMVALKSIRRKLFEAGI